MRGYFAVGADGISKPMNLGNLLRIAHAFGASFFFTIAGRVKLADAMSDTSDAAGHLPIYQFGAAEEFADRDSRMVGSKLPPDLGDERVSWREVKDPSGRRRVFNR